MDPAAQSHHLRFSRPTSRPSPHVPPASISSVLLPASTLPGMSISLPETEWDRPSHVPRHYPEPTQTVPHSGAPGAPASLVQGQGVLVVWVKLGEQGWLPPEERGQLWVTDPRRAGTAAITSGLARAAGRGGEGRGAALISRPGTRAGGRRGSRHSSSRRRRRAVQARPWPAGRRRGAVAPCDAVGQEAWEGRAEEIPRRAGLPPLMPGCHQAQQLEAFKVCP